MDFDTKQQLLAQQLRNYQAQAQTQAPEGRMVGNIYAAPNPLQYIAAGLRGVGGMTGEQMTRQQIQDLQGERQKVSQADLQKFAKALRGSPETQVQSMAPTVGNDPNNPQMQTMPAVPADPYAAYTGLAGSQIPELRQMAAQGLAQLPQREMMQAEKQADREFRAQQLQQQIDARKELQAQSAADRRALAGIVAAGRGGAGAGKPPSGYRFTPAGELEAIPGGPADQKKQGQLNADNASMTSASSALDRLAEVANGLKNAQGLAGITGLRGAIPNIPGTAAADAQAQLETLKSQTAFGVLQAMRDASKTGGALGAVSEKELGLLQNNLAALDKAQSFEAYQKELDKIIRYTDEAKGRLRSAYNMKHGDQAEASQMPAVPGKVRKFNPATGKIE